VFLNANMVFLSISSVDAGGNMVENRSVAQIASYISALTSLGSVILSSLLVRQAKSRQTATDAVSVRLSIPFVPLAKSVNICRRSSWEG
jgi:hypothetical protein